MNGLLVLGLALLLAAAFGVIYYAGALFAPLLAANPVAMGAALAVSALVLALARWCFLDRKRYSGKHRKIP